MTAALPSLPSRAYDDARPDIRGGDVLLCSGSSVFARLIKASTNSPWSHVGFILRSHVIDRYVLLESVESIGVRAVSLRSYISDYNGTGRRYGGRMFVARHRGMGGALDDPLVFTKFFAHAIDLLGYPYDTQQIVGIAARLAASRMGLARDTFLEDKAYICSEYVQHCFAFAGIEIPYNKKGFIAPADFAACDDIEILWEIT